MSEPLSKIPDGMRYCFGREATLRRNLETIVMSVFDGWSYEELATPTVDYYSLFEHGMGSSQAHRAFRFTDTDGRLLALRPDVTSGVARASVTMLADRTRPLRLCYAAQVFRQQPQSHVEWRREFTQAGCELIGANSSASDLEVLIIACEILQRLDLSGNFLITLNDEGVFDGIAGQLELDRPSREEMRQLVDSRNPTDLESFLSNRLPSPVESHELALLTQLSGKREAIAQACRILANRRSIEALERLQKLWAVIEALDLTDCFEIDFGDIARLDYYTGLTFNVYVNGAAVRVGSGGRYDGLTAAFGTAEPAVGFVLDLDALTTVLLSRDTDSISPPGFRVARQVVNPEPATLFREARLRRENGDRVLLDS